MYSWFECKIKYQKVVEDGLEKKVTEPYLVDALNFTEAEARITEEMRPFISGEFDVTNIKKANYSELFFSEEDAADKWYKCKVMFVTLDEKSGKEKRSATYILVQASDFTDALSKLKKGMEGTLADYEIASITETPLLDVYPYGTEKEEKPEFQVTEE
jgi:chlorite dismutase